MSGKGQPGKGGAGNPPVRVTTFGHVSVFTAFVRDDGEACTAAISVRDEPHRSVTLYTAEHRLQTMLETALASGNLISAIGRAIAVDSEPGPSASTEEALNRSQRTECGRRSSGLLGRLQP